MTNEFESVTKYSTTPDPYPLRVLGIISSCGGGDWPPLLSLAVGMQQRGHDVRIICDPGTKTAVHGAGLYGYCLPSHLSFSVIFDPTLQDFFTSGKDLTSFISSPLKRWAGEIMPFVISSLGKWQPTLILGSLLCLGLGEILAGRFGIPWCFVNPSFFFGSAHHTPLKDDFSRLGAQMYEQWLLPHALKATVVLHATDQIFDSLQSPLPQNQYYTGPLFWELPKAVPDFFYDPGPPWILISLSTAPQPDDMELVRTTLSAIENLEKQKVRILVTLTSQHDRAILGGLADNVFITGYLPHSEVLPLCQLAISNAGHGMVMKAIYHGTPMVLVPWGRDQPGVASRAKALGVATIVHRDNCSTTLMAEAIEHSLADPGLTSCSQVQSHRLQKADPLLDACTILESHFCS